MLRYLIYHLFTNNYSIEEIKDLLDVSTTDEITQTYSFYETYPDILEEDVSRYDKLFTELELIRLRGPKDATVHDSRTGEERPFFLKDPNQLRQIERRNK